MARDLRKHAWVWAVPALVFLALGLLRAADGRPAQMGDDAQYLLHAQALADGRDYTDIGYIYTLRNPVVGPNAYPPGGPFLMAPLFRFLDDPIPVVRLLVLLMSFGFVALAGVWALRTFGPATAFAALLLVATNPGIVGSSSRPLSDLSFAFLLWGVFVVASGADRWGPRRVAAITILGMTAILFRAAGITLVPAMLAHVWLQRPDRRRAGWVPVAAWLATFGAVNVLLPTFSSYADQIQWSVGDFVWNVFRATRRYVIALADAFQDPLPWSLANDAYHVVAASLLLVGMVLWIRKDWRDLVAAWGACYLALLLAYTTHTSRFAWPVFPVLLGWTFAGARAAMTRIPTLRRGGADACVVLLAVALAIPSTWRLVTTPAEPDFVDRPDVRALFDHMVGGATREEVRATFFNPRVLTWRTGIPAMGIFDAPPEIVRDELCFQRITHVILGDVRPVKDKDLSFRATVERYPEAFSLEFENESFQVWRFDRTVACGGTR